MRLRSQLGAAGVICLLLLAPSASGQTLRVGHINTTSDAGIYVAERRGYFKQEGLAIELVPFTTAANMIAPLGAGQLEVGGGTVSAGLYNAAARDIPIKIVADKGSIRTGYIYSTLVIRKDLVESGRYKGLADLKGLKIGVAANGTGNAATLYSALKLVGLAWRDVESVQLGFPQQYAALLNKAIDGAILNEPLLSQGLTKGVLVRDARDTEIYPDHQVAVLLYGGPFIEKQPGAALKFMRAYMKGIRDYNDALKDGHLAGPNAEEIIKILIDNTEVKDPAIYRSTSPSAVDPDGKVNVASLEKDLAFFKEEKLIEKPDITASAMLDMRFADQAVKELGPYRPK